MTGIQAKISAASVSAKAYLSTILTTIFLMVSFWGDLSNIYRGLMVLALVFEFISPFLGIKKLDAKEAIEMTLTSIQKIKSQNPGKDFSLLNAIESGLKFLVEFWDKVNSLFKTPAPAVSESTAGD